LNHPTRHLFFTGKGGVGKTSLSAATALALADSGKRVLLVSTDAASNLDEMVGVPLRNTPVAVPGAPGLSVLNIDPDNAAEAYRQRVLAQMEAESTLSERAAVREQLSGACTTEIAAFDEFTALLEVDPKGGTKGGTNAASYDHIVFDTAPTGHTLRLLSLPKAWTGFLAGNDRGASCLGPHSGLKMQEARFQAAMAALTDAQQTTVVLVARPDASTLAEAGRTAIELRSLGLTHQRLVINGVFHASLSDDAVACAIEAQGTSALANLPDALRALPRDEVPLRAFDTVGLSALRALLSGTHADPSADPSADSCADSCADPVSLSGSRPGNRWCDPRDVLHRPNRRLARGSGVGAHPAAGVAHAIPHLVLRPSDHDPDLGCWHCSSGGRPLKAARTGAGRDRGVDLGSGRIARDHHPDCRWQLGGEFRRDCWHRHRLGHHPVGHTGVERARPGVRGVASLGKATGHPLGTRFAPVQRCLPRGESCVILGPCPTLTQPRFPSQLGVAAW
jgi:TRC40/GET3/ArsA family transport-energizing ATPase